jgi:acyl dehydratase
VTEAEILDFARRFDPAADARRPGLGPGRAVRRAHRQRLAHRRLFMRLYADHYLTAGRQPGLARHRRAALAAPLRPGDLLRIRAEVAEARPSRSKPDRGLVRTQV